MARLAYLFNSGSRPLYQENVHRLLGFPPGSEVSLRYNLSRNVPPDLNADELPGSQCLVCFVDRYADGCYVYHPLRKGAITRVQIQEDRLFAVCKMDSHCFVEDLVGFTEAVKARAEGVPELVPGQPESADDGYYIQLSAHELPPLETEATPWIKTARRLSALKAFSEARPVFTKIQISRTRGGSGLPYPKVAAGDAYDLALTYFDPDGGHVAKQLVLSASPPLSLEGRSLVRVGGELDTISIPLLVAPVFRDRTPSVCLELQTGTSTVYRLDLPLSVSPWRLIWGSAIYASLILGAIFSQEFFGAKAPALARAGLELVKWIAAFRWFLTLGQRPQIPTS